MHSTLHRDKFVHILFYVRRSIALVLLHCVEIAAKPNKSKMEFTIKGYSTLHRNEGSFVLKFLPMTASGEIVKIFLQCLPNMVCS